MNPADTTTDTTMPTSSRPRKRPPSGYARAKVMFKAAIGWACIALLLVFVFTNWQSTDVHVLNATLTAPVGFIVVLSALLGAVGAHKLKTVLTWVMRDQDDA